MEIFVNLLIWLHFVALVAGGASSVVMPLIGARLSSASPETRQTLFAIAGRLSTIGRGAMVTLLVTGPLILWLRYGGLEGASIWFWVKMALVLVMLAGVIIAGINFKKSQQGVPGTAQRAELAGKVTAVAFLGVLLSAVMAFN